MLKSQLMELHNIKDSVGYVEILTYATPVPKYFVDPGMTEQ